MGHGGARPGAGRKPGTVNRVTAEVQKTVAASGETPLDFMLRMMRAADVSESIRMDMAKAAAPYVHAKLAAVDATLQANVDGSVTFTWLPTDAVGAIEDKSGE
jgi:hypothetical protein